MANKMRFSSPSELLDQDSEERKAQEGKERSERDLEREKVTLGLIAELRTREATGVGNKGDYYSKLESAVGVKHLARPKELRSYENALVDEARLQTLALTIVEKARAEQQARIDKETDPAKKAWLAKRMPARIPYVVGYARDEEDAEYIVMETVKGRTLSHLMFRTIAEKLYARDPEKYAVLQGAGQWREDVLMRTLMAHVDELKGYSPDDAARVIYNSLHGAGVVSEDVSLQIGAAVAALNRSGLFHRDLHERNVMISEDGTQAWIIDFGSAKHEPSLGKASVTDREIAYDVGEGTRLWNDANVVTSLPALTDRPPTPLKPTARRIRF